METFTKRKLSKVSNLAIKQEEFLVRGEMVKFTESYDVFDYEAKDNLGIVVRVDVGFGKPLIYLPDNGEFCEPSLDIIERVKPGHVPKKAKDFLKNVRRLDGDKT
jgi:hypothetical protein